MVVGLAHVRKTVSSQHSQSKNKTTYHSLSLVWYWWRYLSPSWERELFAAGDSQFGVGRRGPNLMALPRDTRNSGGPSSIANWSTRPNLIAGHNSILENNPSMFSVYGCIYFHLWSSLCQRHLATHYLILVAGFLGGFIHLN